MYIYFLLLYSYFIYYVFVPLHQFLYSIDVYSIFTLHYENYMRIRSHVPHDLSTTCRIRKWKRICSAYFEVLNLLGAVILLNLYITFVPVIIGVLGYYRTDACAISRSR